MREDICGMPHVLRAACDLVQAGCKRVFVIWRADSDPPLIDDLARDERLRGVPVTIVRELPEGSDTVVVVRGDRVCHRDLAKAALAEMRGLGCVASTSRSFIFFSRSASLS